MVDSSPPIPPKPSAYALRLKEAMELDGWLQSVLAGELGISPTAIGKLLKGTSQSLSAENHVKAARLLNVDSEWLALGIGEPRPERMSLRDLNGIEGQLITFFRGIPHEDQDHVLREANNAYSRQHPLPSPANPFPLARPTPSKKVKTHAGDTDFDQL